MNKEALIKEITQEYGYLEGYRKETAAFCLQVVEAAKDLSFLENTESVRAEVVRQFPEMDEYRLQDVVKMIMVSWRLICLQVDPHLEAMLAERRKNRTTLRLIKE